MCGNLWSVGGDRVEDVDQHQEEGDEERLGGRNLKKRWTLFIKQGRLLEGLVGKLGNKKIRKSHKRKPWQIASRPCLWAN